jgi:hypothetical protein
MNGRILRDCACPYCGQHHMRHLSDGDVEGLPVKDGRVRIVCAHCLGLGYKNPASYQSWRQIGGGDRT